jgi:hypothetical protein
MVNDLHGKLFIVNLYQDYLLIILIFFRTSQTMSTASDKLQGRDFIVFSVLPWVIETGSNSKNISTELALRVETAFYI